MRRLRTYAQLASIAVVVVAACTGLGYGIGIHLAEAPVCEAVTVIQAQSLPPAPAAIPPAPPQPQLLPPKRTSQRRILPRTAPPVEQCTPGPVSARPAVPGDEPMNYVPEPGSAALAGAGLVVLAIVRARNVSRKEGA